MDFNKLDRKIKAFGLAEGIDAHLRSGGHDHASYLYGQLVDLIGQEKADKMIGENSVEAIQPEYKIVKWDVGQMFPPISQRDRDWAEDTHEGVAIVATPAGNMEFTLSVVGRAGHADEVEIELSEIEADWTDEWEQQNREVIQHAQNMVRKQVAAEIANDGDNDDRDPGYPRG